MKDKNLFERVTANKKAIDKIYSLMADARKECISAMRELLHGIKDNTIELGDEENPITITYCGRHGDLYQSLLKKVYLDEKNATSLNGGIFFVLDDETELTSFEVMGEDFFNAFELIFEKERKQMLDYINGKVKDNKPYALRFIGDVEITVEEKDTEVTKKIDHIAFNGDFEEDGAIAYTDFQNGEYISELNLDALHTIEIALAKGAYMIR